MIIWLKISVSTWHGISEKLIHRAAVERYVIITLIIVQDYSERNVTSFFLYDHPSISIDRKIQKKCKKLSIDPPKGAVQCPFQPLLNPSEEKNAIGLSRYAEYQGDLTST